MTWSHITAHTLQPGWAKPFDFGEKVPGWGNKVGATVRVRPTSLPPSHAYAGGCGLTLWVSLCREEPDSRRDSKRMKKSLPAFYVDAARYVAFQDQDEPQATALRANTIHSLPPLPPQIPPNQGHRAPQGCLFRTCSPAAPSAVTGQMNRPEEQATKCLVLATGCWPPPVPQAPQGPRSHPQGPAALCFPPDPALCLKQVKPPACPGRLPSWSRGGQVECGTGGDRRDSEAEQGRAAQKGAARRR